MHTRTRMCVGVDPITRSNGICVPLHMCGCEFPLHMGCVLPLSWGMREGECVYGCEYGICRIHIHAHTHIHTHPHTCYGVATISRLLRIISFFCRISSRLWVSFAKETYNLKEPTNRSHPICECVDVNLTDSMRTSTHVLTACECEAIHI